MLVALADIGGVWNVDEVTRALSDFADASVRGGLSVVLTEAADLGRLAAEPDEPAEGSGLVVLALGKHGAGELNYSSDIDLVVFFDPGTRALPDHAEAATTYTRIAQQLASYCRNERLTAMSIGWISGCAPIRAPLRQPSRFRPLIPTTKRSGRTGSGRRSSRQPVAGEVALGQHFLKDLTPFIWRKYFDFAAIADVHAMKRQIHAVRGHDEIAVAGHDIKLGRGGIREIEFFVQTQQLVSAGDARRFEASALSTC